MNMIFAALLLIPLLFAQMINTGGRRKVFSGGTPTPPLTNLVAWYKADSLSASPVASWTDSSGNSHTMAANGTQQPAWSAGQINGLPALGLNGTTQYMGTAAPIPYSGDISIYVVWKCAAVSSPNAFTSNGSVNGAFEYRLASSHQEALSQNTVSLGTGTATLTNGTWYKSAVTYSGSSGALAFYLNGVADGSATNPQTITVNIDTLFSNAGTIEFFSGQVAEILIYNSSTYQPAVDSYLFARYGL